MQIGKLKFIQRFESKKFFELIIMYSKFIYASFKNSILAKAIPYLLSKI